MGKIRRPRLLSAELGISAERLGTLNVVDIALNFDTKLFIDPLLLASSDEPEMQRAAETYRAHFTEIIKLLRASKAFGDVAWRAAEKRLEFHEISGTCLGYGARSTRGSGFGRQLTQRVLSTAKEIVEIGVVDPDLFVAMALFEDNIGPDRIGDMTTNVILRDLVQFNRRVLSELNAPTAQWTYDDESVLLLKNPVSNDPVIFVPRDIVRPLPIVKSRSDIADAAAKNQRLRDRVNKNIGDIWSSEFWKNKRRMRAAVLSSRSSFESLLDAIHEVPPAPYDFSNDPEGELRWRDVRQEVAQLFPLALARTATPDPSYVRDVVGKIVMQFKTLVEDKGLWKEFWIGPKCRGEKAAQRLFFAVADSYCEANNLDVTPEADSGTGPVDFKFSAGYRGRVLVEVKLSTNKKLVPGFEKQLEAYKRAEGAADATYLVIDVGGPDNSPKLLSTRNARMAKSEPVSELAFVDARRRASASKL